MFAMFHTFVISQSVSNWGWFDSSGVVSLYSRAAYEHISICNRYTCVYIYICIVISLFIYIYGREREREIERERERDRDTADGRPAAKDGQPGRDHGQDGPKDYYYYDYYIHFYYCSSIVNIDTVVIIALTISS